MTDLFLLSYLKVIFMCVSIMVFFAIDNLASINLFS